VTAIRGLSRNWLQLMCRVSEWVGERMQWSAAVTPLLWQDLIVIGLLGFRFHSMHFCPYTQR
jgi:hypothetical protein